MTELERLTKRLFSDKDVQRLVNVNAFNGDRYRYTIDELCENIQSAVDRVDWVNKTHAWFKLNSK